MKPLHSAQYPKSHILNPEFQYTHSSQTNLAERFAQIREQQAKQAKPEKVRRVK